MLRHAKPRGRRGASTSTAEPSPGRRFLVTRARWCPRRDPIEVTGLKHLRDALAEAGLPAVPEPRSARPDILDRAQAGP